MDAAEGNGIAVSYPVERPAELNEAPRAFLAGLEAGAPGGARTHPDAGE